MSLIRPGKAWKSVCHSILVAVLKVPIRIVETATKRQDTVIMCKSVKVSLQVVRGGSLSIALIALFCQDKIFSMFFLTAPRNTIE